MPSIKTIHALVFALFVASASCQLVETQASGPLDGHWLIVYPDHKELNAQERAIYAKIQDSMVTLMGLKTVHFTENGEFRQTDSFFATPGKWILTDRNILKISRAGKGLNDFTGQFAGTEKETARIEEMIQVANEKLKLVWVLRKIEKEKYLGLYDEDMNSWRKKARAPESPDKLKEKLRAMLAYFALYYDMIAHSATYFIPTRVPLPFSYYQHGVGLKSFKADAAFNSYFYSVEDAKKAHAILSAAMDKIKSGAYPSAKNFVEEYGLFMKMLAQKI